MGSYYNFMRFKMVSYFMTGVCLFLASRPAIANQCQSFFNKTKFEAMAPETLSILREIEASGKFKVTVLSRPSALGGRKTAIILGETHANGDSSIELVERLRETADVNGYEAFNSSHTVGGRFFDFVIQKVALGLARILKNGGSASGQMQLEQVMADFVKDPLMKEQFEKLAKENKFQELSPDELATFELGNYRGIKITGKNVMDALAGANQSKEYLDLEKGHKISLVDHVSSVLLPSSIVACAAGLCAYYVSNKYGIPAIGNVILYTLAPIVNWVAFQMSDVTGTAKIIGNNKLRSIALPIYTSSIEKRNFTMAKNIAQRLNQDDGIPTVLLAIAGKLHVTGITNLLADDYGFVKITPQSSQ